MNKREMAAKLAKQCDLTQGKALDIINSIFSTESGDGIIAVELDAGRDVRIHGFGTFDTAHRAARKGKNPRTQEAIQIAARTVPRFRAAKGLKDRVAK